MQISWLGYSAFRIQTEGAVLITDPVNRDASFKINKQGADIVVASEGGGEHGDAVSGTPFLISGPGEYEIKGVFVQGVVVNGKTLYMITAEDMSIAFIGAMKISDLTQEQLDVIEGADVLVLPVGGGSVSSAKEAAALINQVEPRIVIPSYFKIKGSKGIDGVEVFLKEYAAPHEELDKLKIKKKDLPQEDTRVIILKA